MFTFLDYSITKHEDVDTEKKVYQLTYWYLEKKSPTIARTRSAGFFTSHQEAREFYNKQLCDALLKEEDI
jgi:hypothetical protein